MPSPNQAVPATPAAISALEPFVLPPTGVVTGKSSKRKAQDEMDLEQSYNATQSAAMTPQERQVNETPAAPLVPEQPDLNASLDRISPWEAAMAIDDVLKKQLATAMCLEVSLQQVTAACMQAQGQFHEQLATLVTLNSAVQHKSIVPMLAASIREQQDASSGKKHKSRKTQKTQKNEA